MSRYRKSVLHAALVACTAGLVMTQLAGGPAFAATPAPATDGFSAVDEALAEHLNVTPARAHEIFAHEAGLSAKADELQKTLSHAASAGAWIEKDQLVVAVTNEAAAQRVRAAGAVARTVAKSAENLDALNGKVATLAKSAPGFASWGVDVEKNTVTVSVLAGSKDAATRKAVAQAKKLGATVTQTDGVPHATASMVGGEEYGFVENGGNYVCSVGFVARDSSGRNAMVSAGHCAVDSSNFTFKGAPLGSVIGARYPGNDYSAFRLDSSVTPTASVSTWNGSTVAVSGSQEGAVGAQVCKSGRTTGWTCGTITAKNRSVSYGSDSISGLTVHNACVEQGDSGGSNISGTQAQGVTSGANLYSSGGRLVCGASVGRANESFYQPVAPILSAYGLTLLTR
ncbi:alpha-lytic protease prodomain-containing protein [Arthrobacter sp. NPDC090010]|uniref:alpha-lytic protease prodomain-containing protein n=1 Tax=Arthrobacter sp. NPDC090010 TaxID=3363942 RepID=UPI0037FAF9B3